MKYLRYYIIIGITLILLVCIFLYNPKILGRYKDKMTIEYSFKDENYTWSIDQSNNNVDIKNISNSKWEIYPKNNGLSTLTFTYKNGEDEKYKIIYELKVKGKNIIWISGEGYGLLDYPNPY